jgi:hypothetical protein
MVKILEKGLKDEVKSIKKAALSEAEEQPFYFITISYCTTDLKVSSLKYFANSRSVLA